MNNITRKVFMHNQAKLEGNLLVAVWELGYSIVVIEDSHLSFDDLCGDSFDPKVNTTISKSKLAKEKREYKARVENEGVYGIGLSKDGNPLYETFVWGFVGADYIRSGYDADLIGQLETLGAKL